jgi:hypothetical protein
MSTLYNFVDAQRLLIKPFDRIWFIVIFVSMTAICRSIADLCWSQPIFDLVWEQNKITFSICSEIITGTMVGFFQWLVLRRYISSWKWILSMSMSFAILSIYRAATMMWMNSSFAVNLSRSEGMNATVILAIIFVVVLIIAIFIGGYLQWYVLRPYVMQAQWWILVPFIATIVGGVPIALRFLPLLSPNLSLLPPFNSAFISLTMLPAIQAIGFCALTKKFSDERPILQTPLAVAPDINNYWEIERIKKTLDIRISRIWKTDLEPVVGKLTYLVGVDRSCTQTAYEPMDRNSLDNIALTPLPELVESSNYGTGEVAHSTALAKFQVVLAPPGTVEIKSWRGIPLKWLALAVYMSIMGISVLLPLVNI